MAATTPGTFAPVVALFLAAPSPGQVYRFLERQSGRTAEQRGALDALGWLLSDAATADGLRALTGTGPGLRAFLESRGASFATAFADAPVTLVWADDRGGTGVSEWGWRVWKGDAPDAPPESFSEAAPRAGPGPGARLLARLTGGVAVGDGGLVRARAWARARGLPIDRVPAATGRALPVVEYATVAALDQKGLLVEDRPRLYRLSWAPIGAGGG